VPGLLRVFTFRTRGEIEHLEQETRDRPAARMAQRVLAAEVTELVHGQAEMEKAIAASRALFGQGDLAALDPGTLAAAIAEIPSVQVGWASLLALGQPTVADLMAATGLVPSKSEARRAIAGGGAYLNNQKVTEPDARPAEEDLLHGRFLVLRRGKRTVAGVEVIRS
jgi:tyrosyl-tRNA synthetase